MNGMTYSVFTKPWKTLSLEALGELVRDMGFDAVEYPLREGFQVQPAEGAAGILRLCRTLGRSGVRVASIAGGVYAAGRIDEGLFAGCAEAGVGVVRICQELERGLEFHRSIEKLRREYDALVPYCEKYGVTLGVQMHCGHMISSAAETYLLLQGYDPRHIAAVWDAGHNGLAGTEPELALDTVWDRLCMVNFKAAFRLRSNGPEAREAQWQVYWTTGRQGCGSWRAAAAHLVRRGYRGVVCLPAEYSDEAHVEQYAREDLAYIRELFAQAERPEA